MAIEPRPPGVAKISGTEFWRIRVGDLRIVYVFDDSADRVVVLKVARRSERTYRRIRSQMRTGTPVGDIGRDEAKVSDDSIPLMPPSC